jgi:hypothetical protein
VINDSNGGNAVPGLSHKTVGVHVGRRRKVSSTADIDYRLTFLKP